MKKRFFIVLTTILTSLSAYAQYEPTTTWPYIYPDFISGELKSIKTGNISGKFNIHLLHETLHFIDGDMIREANTAESLSVKIGNDHYVNCNGRMMKVLTQNQDVYITESSEIDVVALNSTGGAYGSSSASSATTAYSSLEAIGTGVTGVNHMEMKNRKDEGKTLPLIHKKYIVFPGYAIYATRKDVMELGAIDPKELGNFLKERKIKWKDTSSLLELGLYLNEKINAKK